ncbi:hypothetical protein B0J13DRAFT_556110, partial [Dactylonectria estremocensis]
MDTPSFNDYHSTKPEGEVMAEMAEFLATQHASGIPVLGILHLQRITDVRMKKSSLMCLRLLGSLVGEAALQNTILVTTMWDKLAEDDQYVALRREQALINNFWASMVDKGSSMGRFDGTPNSAYSLVFRLVGKQRVILDMQKQILDDDMFVLETSAGSYLASQLEKEKEEYQREIADVESLLQRELRSQSQDRAMMRTLNSEKIRLAGEILQNANSIDYMKVRPGESIRERVQQAIKDAGVKARRNPVVALTTVLGLDLFVVQLEIGDWSEGGF